MRERTYFAQLCLLQLSFGDQAVCIDTLALTDLSPLRPAMASACHRQGAACRAPGSGSAGARDRAAGRAVRHPGGGGADRTAGAGRLRRAGADSCWARACTRRKRAPTGRAVRCPPRRSPTHSMTCAICSRCANGSPSGLRALGRWSWFEEEMAQLDAAGSFAVDPEQSWRRLKGIARTGSGAPGAGARTRGMARTARDQFRSAAQLDPAGRRAARHGAAGAAQHGAAGAHGGTARWHPRSTAAPTCWR